MPFRMSISNTVATSDACGWLVGNTRLPYRVISCTELMQVKWERPHQVATEEKEPEPSAAVKPTAFIPLLTMASVCARITASLT